MQETYSDEPSDEAREKLLIYIAFARTKNLIPVWLSASPLTTERILLLSTSPVSSQIKFLEYGQTIGYKAIMDSQLT